MKKTIKSLESKSVGNTKSVKGGSNEDTSNPYKPKFLWELN